MKKLVVKSTLSDPNIGSRDSMISQRFLEAQTTIKISYFWGAEDYIDAVDWIELYDNIATDYNWTSTNKIVRLGGYLRKHALVWYVQVIKAYPIEHTAWSAYKSMFVKRFSPAAVEKTSSSRSDASSMSSGR